MKKPLPIICVSLACLVSQLGIAQGQNGTPKAAVSTKEYGPTLLKAAIKIEIQSNDRKFSKEVREEYSRSYHIEIKHAYDRLVVGAKEGDLESMFCLGAYCQTFNKEGFATVRECLPWLEKAAMMGHPEAPYDYAGELLKLDTQAEKSKGLEWLKRATHSGDPKLRGWAAAELANLYTFGNLSLGLRRNPKTAWMWIRKGAQEAGCSEGDLMIERGLRNPDKVETREILLN